MEIKLTFVIVTKCIRFRRSFSTTSLSAFSLKAAPQFYYFLIKESGRYGMGDLDTLIIWALTKVLLCGVVCQVFINDTQLKMLHFFKL